MKTKLFVIFVLLFVSIEAFFFNTTKTEYTKNKQTLETTQTNYNNLIKEIGNNIEKINTVNTKLETFKKQKQKLWIFHLKHFLEWILPRNKQLLS